MSFFLFHLPMVMPHTIGGEGKGGGEKVGAYFIKCTKGGGGRKGGGKDWRELYKRLSQYPIRLLNIKKGGRGGVFGFCTLGIGRGAAGGKKKKGGGSFRKNVGWDPLCLHFFVRKGGWKGAGSACASTFFHLIGGRSVLGVSKFNRFLPANSHQMSVPY